VEKEVFVWRHPVQQEKVGRIMQYLTTALPHVRFTSKPSAQSKSTQIEDVFSSLSSVDKFLVFICPRMLADQRVRSFIFQAVAKEAAEKGKLILVIMEHVYLSPLYEAAVAADFSQSIDHRQLNALVSALEGTDTQQERLQEINIRQRRGMLIANRYRIISELGRGGMGSVSLVEDENFGVERALKMLNLNDVLDPEPLIRAFSREAKILAKLRHPGLPIVFDYFQENNQWFLVLDYIKGEDFGVRLSGNVGLPLRHWHTNRKQLFEIVDFLHSQKQPVIHGDIKPQNLKLKKEIQRKESQLVLLDFGLSRYYTGNQTRYTITGHSEHYSPIELTDGDVEQISPRTDIYSLGATLFHMLTGVKPPTASKRAMAKLRGEDDPLKLPFQYRTVMNKIGYMITKSMELDPKDRFSSVKEMQDAIGM
jgi:hypothetical protein